MKNALSERSAMSVRYDVRAWFEAELRKNSGNLKGVVQWGNDLARAANAYIRTGDPDQFVDMHLALMKPVPKELREEARKSLLFFMCADVLACMLQDALSAPDTESKRKNKRLPHPSM